MTSTTPFFPGYTTQRKRETLLKQQNFKVVAGLMEARKPDPRIIDLQIDETRRKLEQIESVSRQLDTESTGLYVPDYTDVKVPETVVLRFFAYFKQSLVEAGDETYRVRYVRIYYYMEDDTIMIEEHKDRNSGMDQGVLLRRMKVENPHAKVFGTKYTLADLNVGIEIDLAGVVYHIYDCDALTRRFLSANGVDVPPAEGAPEDLYTLKRKLTDRPIRVTYIDTDKTHLRDFLDFDGMVLRFYAVWDDRHAVFGEKRKFVVHFYLVDKTIEIRQVLPPNSGRDPVSKFLQKTLLKRPDCNAYYTAKDLYIGQTLDVFGRLFFLYDADKFTQEWLDKEYGPHDWTPINVDEHEFYYDSRKAAPPPHNGWGSEEDSLGYCYSLHPVPPKKDVAKMLRNQGQLLRFAAKFTHEAPQDVGRQFVIVYDLSDDTIGVFEKPRRNSGFREGKFIQKARLKNPLTGTYFKPSDLRLGSRVTINSYEFDVTGADEYAIGRMEADADDFPQADLVRIIEGCKRDARAVSAIRKQFEAADKEGTGYATPDDAKYRITRIFGLPEHEAVTIVRRFTEPRGFDYYSFTSVLN